MQKYRCTVCGYIYDPAEGDPMGNIPPGTSPKTSPTPGAAPTAAPSRPLSSRRGREGIDFWWHWRPAGTLNLYFFFVKISFCFFSTFIYSSLTKIFQYFCTSFIFF